MIRKKRTKRRTHRPKIQQKKPIKDKHKIKQQNESKKQKTNQQNSGTNDRTSNVKSKNSKPLPTTTTTTTTASSRSRKMNTEPQSFVQVLEQSRIKVDFLDLQDASSEKFYNIILWGSAAEIPDAKTIDWTIEEVKMKTHDNKSSPLKSIPSTTTLTTTTTSTSSRTPSTSKAKLTNEELQKTLFASGKYLRFPASKVHTPETANFLHRRLSRKFKVETVVRPQSFQFSFTYFMLPFKQKKKELESGCFGHM